MKVSPNRRAGVGAGALVFITGLLLYAGSIQAHGTDSEIRILGQSLDGYEVNVRTAPKRPRTGRLHIEVQLIAPDSLTYVDAATVTATARLRTGTTHQVGPAGSHYQAPWHEMNLNLNESGVWDIHLVIDGPYGRRKTTFRVEVLPD